MIEKEEDTVGMSLVIFGVYIIIISIPPPLVGGTNSNESVPTLYTVL
jgi:alpha/beta superfamily hydrolase